ncbi:hypothetical protein AAFF_G00108990 [Aldrovandia affinis]|uniref:Uncharacterized protein n=1 Tax=Aldrovandia affinis TaxID=143900 RepID=A0AAD7WBC3_9TELE|nr:hypothetical protein AAFF_G00108990 [Aldrovandia affinis]
MWWCHNLRVLVLYHKMAGATEKNHRGVVCKQLSLTEAEWREDHHQVDEHVSLQSNKKMLLYIWTASRPVDSYLTNHLEQLTGNDGASWKGKLG